MAATETPRPAQQDFQDDEIDLFELWNQLVEEKLTIILSFVIVLALAAVYAFTAAPTYQSSAYFLPPQKDAIQEINILDIQLERIPSYTPKIATEAFIRNLNSKVILEEVFKENDLIEAYSPDSNLLSEDQYPQVFAKGFESFLKDYKFKNSGTISVTLSMKLSGVQVREVLSQITDAAIEKAIQELVNEVVLERQAIINHIQKSIVAVRDTEKLHRMDRVVRLEEAIKVARQLNIAESKMAIPDQDIIDASALYNLGYKHLEAERKMLLDRVSDDPYIVSLRGLEERLALLQAVEIDLGKVKVISVDQSASLGQKVKPKEALILAVAGVLGLMLGVFIALIRQAIKRRKENFKVAQSSL